MSNLIQRIENCFLDALRQGNVMKANKILSATGGRTYDSIKKMIENEHYILRNLRAFLSKAGEMKLAKIASAECGLTEALEEPYEDKGDSEVDESPVEIVDTLPEEDNDLDDEIAPEGDLIFFFDKSDKTLKKLKSQHLYDVWCFFDDNIVPLIERMGYEIFWHPQLTPEEKASEQTEPATLFDVTIVDAEKNRRATFSAPMADVWKLDPFEVKKYVSQLMTELNWEERGKKVKKAKKFRRFHG